ncbi:MAG: hypothetical protein RL701_5524, partial [Pseudomonadota bacterium]
IKSRARDGPSWKGSTTMRYAIHALVKRSKRNLLRVACIVACCSVVATGNAQSKPSAANSDEYQQLVQQALHEYQLGNFSEAKVFFQRAHALSPNARTLRGLGMSAYELRNYVDAISFFEQALSSQQRPLTAQMEAEVTQLLGQARSFVAHLDIRVDPASAELRIDTRSVKRDADGTVALDPGAHEIVVEAAGYESATRTLRTNGAETLKLHIALHAEGTAGAPLQPNGPDGAPAGEPTRPGDAFGGADTPTSNTASSEAGTGTGAGPWILIGAGGAVAIAGGVLLAVALSNKNAVENPSAVNNQPPVYREYESRDKLVFPLSTIGITALSLGAASMVGGLVWKITTSGGQERTPAASAQLQFLPGQVRLSGHF